MPDSSATIESTFRRKAGEIHARLLRAFGVESFALVEEAVQTAFLRAVERWPSTGVPANPGGWLFAVARNAVLESLRRRQAEQRREEVVARDSPQVAPPTEVDELITEAEDLDDLAEMVLLCCNPDLSERAQICLTLKVACGFSTREIARLLGSASETVKKTITRARERVAAQPDVFRSFRVNRVSERFRAVLETIYAVFTEGYAASHGDTSFRREVAMQAVRLGRALSESSVVPGEVRGELEALRALMLFQIARFEARIDSRGASVRLVDQDRSLWDQAAIAEGLRALERSTRSPRLTAIHLEARIAAVHSTSPSFHATDWRAILGLYDQLLGFKETPAVRLNRIVAMRYVAGPAPALVELEELMRRQSLVSAPGVSSRHAVRADLLEALNRHDEASVAWKDAISSCSTTADRKALLRRAGRSDDVPERGGAASSQQEETP